MIPARTSTKSVTAILTLTAAVLLILASGLVMVPNVMGALYGTAVSPSGTSAARTAGAAIFSLCTLAWLSRKQEVGAVRTLAIQVLFVWFVLKSIVAYLAVANGVFNPFVGQAVLFFDVLLTIIYGYYFFS